MANTEAKKVTNTSINNIIGLGKNRNRSNNLSKNKIINLGVYNYLLSKKFKIAVLIRSLSSVFKLDPDGKHKPLLNNFSATPDP